MRKIRSIHFTGIKGVGMTPLAVIAKEAGMSVTGSDIADEFITDEILKKAGITQEVGFEKDHVGSPDLLICTGAHGGFDNTEVQFAKKNNIPVWTQGQAAGEFMNGGLFGKSFTGISVAGCHGKTTTTAMLATILKVNNFDPSFAIGTGEIVSLGSSGHFGKGDYFIAEADEYATEPVYDRTVKFLWQHPQYAIFTNIEFDHPDLFPTIDDVRHAFLQFAHQLPANGKLITCADGEQVKRLLKEYTGGVITYGISPVNDFVITHVTIEEGQMFFTAKKADMDLGEFSLQVVGEHNAVNALGAAVAGLELGLNLDQIKKGLSVFKGTKRRFEFIGTLSAGALLYDDYAHHPTEIAKTLEAFRKSFPKKHITCIFQPHTYSRTKSLFTDFTHSFGNADTVILTDIYPSLREAPDPQVSSERLAMSIKNVHKDCVYLPKLSDVVQYLGQKKTHSDDLIILMGAGDVYKIAEQLQVIHEKLPF